MIWQWNFSSLYWPVDFCIVHGVGEDWEYFTAYAMFVTCLLASCFGTSADKDEEALGSRENVRFAFSRFDYSTTFTGLEQSRKHDGLWSEHERGRN